MAKQKINDRQTESSTLLFNGTIARVVTLSEAYTNFKYLIVVWQWVNQRGTVFIDTALSQTNFNVVRQGQIDGLYRVHHGAATISMSGTTMTGSNAGGTYTIESIAGGAMSFRDNVGDVTIVKVMGIR